VSRLTAALDAAPLLDPTTGIARYTLELVRGLERLGARVKTYAVSLRGRRDASLARWRLPARAVQMAWRRFDRPSISRLVGPVDVVHGTNFVLPPLASARGVVTVHDLSYLRPDAFPGAGRLRDLVPWSVARAARTLVPTRAVGAEVVERYGVPEDALAVTHEGVSNVFFGARPLASRVLTGMGITEPFALAVGTIEPRKNLGRLLEAWRRARRDLAGWTLVLAGPRGWGPGLPRTGGVVTVGWVGDETLPGLVAAADVFCYPSLYEGFGLPPLEAMAAGTVALVGRYPAAPEVVGDAALLVEPTDVDAIADGLCALATDERLRRRLAIAGRARATGYTWEATARATLRAYEEACA
jgi:glycosyltransferase involved in cell wall biosynthesis